MRRELDDRLCNEFPLLYRDRYSIRSETTCTYDGFGFVVGEGWFRILHKLSSRLEPLITAQPENARAAAAQVKEKFGRLRFYLTENATEEMLALVGEAERESATTCERCGIAGVERTDTFWIKTLCDWCAAERRRHRREITEGR